MKETNIHLGVLEEPFELTSEHIRFYREIRTNRQIGKPGARERRWER